MTISTTANKVLLLGNGATGTAGAPFSYAFIIPDAGSVVATYTDTAGTQTTLITSEYAITGLNDPNGGTFTYPLSGSAIASGASVLLERIVPFTQAVVLTNQGGFYPEVVEAALDTLVMQTQQLEDLNTRAITANSADVSPVMSLPVAATRANGVLGFDANGDVAITNTAGAVTYSNMLSKTGGTMTGPINETMATVSSSATTSDIWGATASNVIEWTGTATTTGFPAAPVAGARRLLRCTAACKFTPGANLLIEGIVSGNTITMNANAMVEVVALTTTTFKLRYSLSGSFMALGTGFTTTASATWYYSVINGIVHISPHNAGIGSAQTATGTAFTITGFPAEILPAEAAGRDTRLFMNLVVKDSGAYVNSGYGTLDTTGIMNLYTSPAAAGWTSGGAAGNKLFIAQELNYSL